jgi:diacylglycerol kinase
VERGRHGLLKSFAFAWAGLAEGAVRDRNLRIHLALGVLAGVVAARAPLEPVERALLVACVAAVIAAEAFNTALEAAVDLGAPGWDERARAAKDSAAGAVLALAAGSVLVLASLAVGRARALLEASGLLGVPGAAALLAAAATALLPAPRPRSSRAADVLLAVAAIAGLAIVARDASGQAGSVAAALCVAIAIGGAARRPRLPK